MDWTIFAVFLSYFLLLYFVSRVFAGKKHRSNDTFFSANKNSNWALVAFGMVGTALSGVTFLSVPGEVSNSNFYYGQLLIGNVIGYWLVALVLIPLYYRLNLVTVYELFGKRYGKTVQKTASWFFLVSQLIGAAFRLYLVALVLQLLFFERLGVPFEATVLLTLVLIWVYTYRGGLRTIVITDTLQTCFMLLAAVFTVVFLCREMNLHWVDLSRLLLKHPKAQLFDWDWQSPSFSVKQILAGIAISLVMSGLDQNQMQKSLSCRNVGEAKKNVFWFSISFFLVSGFFLFTGLLLYLFAQNQGVSLAATDQLFTYLSMHHFPVYLQVLFVLGVSAAAFSSADSSLAALTTSFCVDILEMKGKEDRGSLRVRKASHVVFVLLLFFVIVLFKWFNNDSVVMAVFRMASYTYGPILGLFAFSYFFKRKPAGKWVPWVCVLSPALSYVLNANAQAIFWGYQFGFELLLVNALLTVLGLWLVSAPVSRKAERAVK